MICACLGDENMNKTQLFIGFFQFLTSIYLVGWIFSIYWGVLIVQKSRGDHEQLKGLIGKGQQTSEQLQQINKANAKLNPYEDKRWSFIKEAGGSKKIWNNETQNITFGY